MLLVARADVKDWFKLNVRSRAPSVAVGGLVAAVVAVGAAVIVVEVVVVVAVVAFDDAMV